MEVLFYRPWVTKLSLFISVSPLILMILLQSGRLLGIAALVFGVVSTPTLPGFFRWLLCKDWPEATAKVIKIKKLTEESFFLWNHPPIYWGLHGMGQIAHYEAEIEYRADHDTHRSKMLLLNEEDTLNSVHTIYYDPLDSAYFTRKKKLGIDGFVFLVTFVVLIVFLVINF